MSGNDLRKIEKLRRKIDRVDQKVLKVFQKRFAIVDEIGKLKAKQGLAARQKRRSQEIVTRLAKMAHEMGLNPVLIKSVYDLIFKEAVRLQTTASPVKRVGAKRRAQRTAVTRSKAPGRHLNKRVKKGQRRTGPKTGRKGRETTSMREDETRQDGVRREKSILNRGQ